jgi:predicted nuclease of predicted toxin-antitoxin system
LTVRFLVDMPLSPALAAWLRSRGHDAVHASEQGLNRARDIDIMERAKREERTVITVDLDYPRLLALARGTDPSLILFRGGNWSDADIVARVDEIMRSLTIADIARSIVVVERNRVRRRKLPIEP